MVRWIWTGALERIWPRIHATPVQIDHCNVIFIGTISNPLCPCHSLAGFLAPITTILSDSLGCCHAGEYCERPNVGVAAGGEGAADVLEEPVLCYLAKLTSFTLI